MTGLSDLVSERLHAMRVDELKVAGKFRTMLAIAVIIGSISHVAIPVIMLITYVFVAQREGRGDELTSAKVFTALSLVSLLAYPIQNMAKAMPQLAAAAGCFQRIQLYVLNGGDRCYNRASLESGTWATDSTKFVPASSDVEKLQRATTPATSPTAAAVASAASEKQTLLSVRNASFTIRGTKDTLLKDMSFTIRPDTWTIITGEVGSGKSILLLALLGELDLSSGSLDRAPLLGGGVGYCAQDAWLPNLSIRDIITANDTRDSTADETWYSTVIQACVLRADFDELPFGDRTEIGSNGVSLSGGQKQRVSLARAIYSRKPLLILDDVLSGLDPTTEQNIVDEIFGCDGLLRKHSMAAILATHSGMLLIRIVRD
jgi:ATP-binding cassette, subfamily C (CFTR/MRP), member 1